MTMNTIDPNAFVKGWRRLPAELKLQILAYLVPTVSKYRAITFSKVINPKLFLKAHGRDHDFDNCIFPLLACSEIVTLVKQMFYGQNLMLIRNYPVGPYLRYPPKTINGFVKNLEVILNFKTTDLNFLRKLSDGDLGFPTLRDVSVRFNTQNQCDAEDPATVAEAVVKLPHIIIRAESLTVRLLYDYTRPKTPVETSKAELRADMYRCLLEKISLKDGYVIEQTDRRPVYDEEDQDGKATISTLYMKTI
jgi:hypothetical protein